MALTLGQGLAALFEAPFDDADISATQLVYGYVRLAAELSLQADEIDALSTDTVDRALRQAAADIYITAMLSGVFCALAEAMAGKAHVNAYLTSDEVGSDVTRLGDAWERISDRALDPDLRAQLSEIFTRTNDVLLNLEVTLPHITEFNAPEMPASVLSYWLYDTDDKTLVLTGLNTDVAPWLYDGAVDVLSIEGL